MRRGLEAVPVLRQTIAEVPGDAATSLVAGLRDCADTAALIAASIDDDGAGRTIRPGFSGELDSLRATAKDARQYLADLERRERERSGIKTLKVGYNRVFGYYIEVSRAHSDAVPADYIRKQTLVGGERYSTAELQEHEYRVLHAEELRAETEDRLLAQVCVQIAAAGQQVLDTAAAIAGLMPRRFRRCASHGYVRPTVDDGMESLSRRRHPVVEECRDRVTTSQRRALIVR
jgi:DNA mismatch repair protein MutS